MKCDICGKIIKSEYNYSLHTKTCKENNNLKDIVRDEYINGLSIKKLSLKYKKSPNTINYMVKDISRSLSNASKLAHLRYSDNFKHSEETKEKLRVSRVNYLKENYKKTAWFRKSNNKMSYGEKYVHTLFKKYKLYEKFDIINEYSVYPYFIDFAFVNEKVAVEYDGKVHFEKGNKRIEHDFKKDEYLISKGWKIFRIPYYELYSFDINNLIKFIGNPLIKNYDNYLLQYNGYKQSLGKTLIEQQKKDKNNKIELIKKELLNSNIDFTKFGWVNKAANIIGIRTQHVNKWMKKNMHEFYKNCFIKNI